MKKILLGVIIIYPAILFSQISSFYPYYNYKTLDANNININLNNVGDLEATNQIYGAKWNQIPDSIIVYGPDIVYDQGIWVIGKINGFPHLGIAQWLTSYSPGPIINNQAAMLINPKDSLLYRAYKISTGDNSSNPDFAEWPKDLGAPVDQFGNPQIYADQTIWTVYNSVDSTLSYRQLWNQNYDTLPIMPVEIQQLAYSRIGNSSDYVDIFSNIVFFEWTIINKGENKIDSCYISLWTDIDFSYISDNLPAVDTNYQTGYCWSNSNKPGEKITVGYVLLYGPTVPSIGSSAIFKGRVIKNAKNLDLSSFHFITDDSQPSPPGDPAYSLKSAWNIARGFETNGDVIIDPETNKPTKFPLSGDPVTNSGWIYSDPTGGGAGFNLFTGPFDLAPSDTQWVMMALIPALGKDKIESINMMRYKAWVLRSTPYESLAYGVGEIRNDNKKFIPKDFNLFQNYPNPFNPYTKIKYYIPDFIDVNTASTINVELKVYDILGREITTLVHSKQPPGEYEVIFNANALPSGVYLYKLTAGSFVETRKMILLR